MTETSTLLELIQRQLDEFCEEQRASFAGISDDLSPILDYTQSLLSGGKRFRAQFAYWAWSGCLPASGQTPEQQRSSAEAIVGITAALEMFHAAALVHDDLMDQSDTRRGQMAVHRKFEQLHTGSNWAGNPERFGQSSAILVGDLMLGWASELFGHAIMGAPNREVELACRDEFNKMRIEVMAGQYLDVVEENAGPTRPSSEAVGRANRVMLYKTAKYSIEAPLLIGASFGGASESTLHGLSNFAIPLGLAFQLKDDILGVFGDSIKTGKPVGDDLREGKRTVLIGLTRESLSPSVARIFDELLSARDLTGEQINFLQHTIRGSGALAKTERMLEELAEESLTALSALDLAEPAKSALGALARKVIERES